MTFLTYKYRLKDSRSRNCLARKGRAVNAVWNYCCEIQQQSERRQKSGGTSHWPTAFDLINLCARSSKMLGIHGHTVSAVCRQFAVSRTRNKGCPAFRASGGSRRALGWIPFKVGGVQISGSSLSYLKYKYRFWKSREMEGEFKAGAFVEDARGRWYVVFQCEQLYSLQRGSGQIGIDLGLRHLATCSDGATIPALQYYRQHQEALAVAQRAGSKRRVRAIHAKIKNSRRHYLHEWSTKIARENALIVVGNVSSTQLAKTRMAKSVLDASWGMLRSQLAYKASRHGARYVEVPEHMTSRTCSNCGIVPNSSPKGMGALGIRSWICSNCGESHDRDINAAVNILKIGLERQPPGEEICKTSEDVKSRCIVQAEIA